MDIVYGIAFFYKGNDFVIKEWSDYEGSRWEKRYVPEGYQIVGMFGSWGYSNFDHLGFNLLPIDRKLKPWVNLEVNEKNFQQTLRL